jgi:hypothetical protein
VPDKSDRVHLFHRNTVNALAEFIAAMGLDHTSQLAPHHAVKRISASQVTSLDDLYPFITPNELIDGKGPARIQRMWNESSAETFAFDWSAGSHR